jgi:nonribosomal peptide synthetase DhbF
MDIWKTILKKSRIGIEDDFFKLGGDSLLAALLYSQIELKLGVQIPINILFHKTTIRELAGFIDHREAAANRFKFIVPIKSTGYKNPLFCMHPGDGEATTYHSIGKYMEENRPVYGLRFVPEGADWIHPLTFDQMGEEYAKEIQSLDPYGPYNLCGTCYGGVLAFATASALARAGKGNLHALHAGFHLPEEFSKKEGSCVHC